MPCMRAIVAVGVLGGGFTSGVGHCRQRRLGCVRIIHGKGLGSHHREPVLKGLLRRWLVREDVLAFSQAPAPQGGSGAVLVLLKS